MTNTTVSLGEAARTPFLEGVNCVADLVAFNIGPFGRALLSARDHGAPVLLRGGYAIAKEVEFEENGLRAGATAMRQLAAEAHARNGDGTSLTLIMARTMIHGMMRGLAAGFSPVAMREALLAHTAALSAAIDAMTQPLRGESDLEQVALRAAGGDPAIGRIVFSAHQAAGTEGFVIIEKGHGIGDEISIGKGHHFPDGWLSPHFLTDVNRQRVELSNPLILFHQGTIDSFRDMARVLEMIAGSGKSLLIIADSFEAEAMATLIANTRDGGLKVAPMKTPSTGPWRALQLEDLAVATGGTVIGQTVGTTLANLRPAMLGQAENVTMTREVTTITGGKGSINAISERMAGIRLSIKRERYLSFDREQHQKRLARFGANICKLRIGGVTSTDIAVREARATSVASALRATREGVVAGGAAALIKAGQAARPALPAGELGRMLDSVLSEALRAPLEAIVRNAGLDGREISYRVENEGLNQVFDVEARQFVAAESAKEPANISKDAVRAAISFAANFIVMEASIWK